MLEYGRCKINTSYNGRCEGNTSEPPSSAIVLSIAANSEPEFKLIETAALPTAKASLGYGITIHTTALRYPIQMSIYLPVYTMKSRFCNQ